MHARAILPCVLLFSFIPRFAAAQSEEKHVLDIRAEQTPEKIAASDLCKHAVDAHLPLNRPYQHLLEVNPRTLEKDLPSLFQKSDEVVLVDFTLRNTFGISPSGQDAVTYQDFKVLRSWKGSHKPGDLITMGTPSGMARCNADVTASTFTARDDKWLVRSPENGWHGLGVLFLRKDTTGRIDGLTPTGGDGTQGVFEVKSDLWDCFDNTCATHTRFTACFHADRDPASCGKLVRSPSFPECSDPKTQQVLINQCASLLDAGNEKIHIYYGRDPLLEKYQDMPISRFLKEVQKVAGGPEGASLDASAVPNHE